MDPEKVLQGLWDERFTALSISQHWYMDKDALDAFEGNQECPSEI